MIILFGLCLRRIKSSNLSLETQNGVLVARRGISKDQLEKEKKEKMVKEEEEIEDAIGFSKVIRELSRSVGLFQM